jgi:hypothetical protein
MPRREVLVLNYNEWLYDEERRAVLTSDEPVLRRMIALSLCKRRKTHTFNF